MGGRDPWAGFAAGPSSGSYPKLGNGSDAPGDNRAVADLARRLQDRVDGQEALLERVAVLAQLADDRARIAELRDIGRRLRRDSEALLLLCGSDPGCTAVHPTPCPPFSATPWPWWTSPPRHGAPLAAGDAVDDRRGGAAAPGRRAGRRGRRGVARRAVEVDARLEPDGALRVEVLVAGSWLDGRPGWHRKRRGPDVAGGRAARPAVERDGIRLERPLIDHREGVVATLHCPAALVTAQGGGDPGTWATPRT